MTPDPLRAIDTRQRRDVRLLYETLADSLATSIGRQSGLQGGQRIVTEADRIRIMADVDVALDVIYGARPNDPDAALTQIVLRGTTAARFEPLDVAVKAWRGAMPRAVRERVEAEARGNGAD